MRIYIIRHGQTEWNARGCAQGHTDTDLDEVGHKQARLIGDAFRELRVGRIVCSDLRRCQQTAAPLSQATGCEIETFSELRERTFGTLEGEHYTVLRSFFESQIREHKCPNHKIRPENGESLQDVWERVKPIRKSIERRRKCTAVFTHGGTAALLLAQLLRAPITVAASFRFTNATITEIKMRPDKVWQLVRFADASHLAELDG